MSLGVMRDLRSPRAVETAEDSRAYQEHLLAEYVFARTAHGVLDAAIRQDVAAVEEFSNWAGVWASSLATFLSEAQRARRWRLAGARRRASLPSIASWRSAIGRDPPAHRPRRHVPDRCDQPAHPHRRLLGQGPALASGPRAVLQCVARRAQRGSRVACCLAQLRHGPGHRRGWSAGSRAVRPQSQ
jgi:hypothetical protein